MGHEGNFRDAWDDLLYSLRTGEGAFRHVAGMSYFEYVSGNADAAAIFNDGLTAYTAQVAGAVVGAYDFSSFRKLVDVGAGHGTLMAAILTATPSLTGIVFDLPHAKDGAMKTLGTASLAARSEVVTGDFFDGLRGATPISCRM